MMIRIKKRKLNHNFYKAISFWLGVILIPETINDLFLQHNYTFANWGTLFVIILLMTDSFLIKIEKWKLYSIEMNPVMFKIMCMSIGYIKLSSEYSYMIAKKIKSEYCRKEMFCMSLNLLTWIIINRIVVITMLIIAIVFLFKLNRERKPLSSVCWIKYWKITSSTIGPVITIRMNSIKTPIEPLECTSFSNPFWLLGFAGMIFWIMIW